MHNYKITLNNTLEDINITELHINNLDISGFFNGNLNIANLYNTYESSFNIIGKSLNINNNFKVDSLGNLNFNGTINQDNSNNLFSLDTSNNIYANDIFTCNKYTPFGSFDYKSFQSLNDYLYSFPPNTSQEIIDNLSVDPIIFDTIGITCNDLSFNLLDLSDKDFDYIQDITKNPTGTLIYKAHIPVYNSSSPNQPVIEDASGNSVIYTGSLNDYPQYIRNKIFIVTGESCPYCAYQRWPLIIALKRFGTFKGLLNIQSASWDESDSPGKQTFSFRDLKYDSSYFSVEAIEYNNILGNIPFSPLPFYNLSPYQINVFNTFNAFGGTPFINFGNSWIINSALIHVSKINWLSRSRISNELTDINNEITKDIIASANIITALISQITGNQPENICNSPGVLAAKVKLGIN